MPKIEKPQSDPMFGPELPAAPTLGAQIDIVTGFLRRRYLLILTGLLLSVPLGALYLRITPASYTASAVMMIEPRKSALDSLVGSAMHSSEITERGELCGETAAPCGRSRICSFRSWVV